jgi:hypothetical protein
MRVFYFSNDFEFGIRAHLPRAWTTAPLPSIALGRPCLCPPLACARPVTLPYRSRVADCAGNSRRVGAAGMQGRHAGDGQPSGVEVDAGCGRPAVMQVDAQEKKAAGEGALSHVWS